MTLFKGVFASAKKQESAIDGVSYIFSKKIFDKVA